jgi:hypothetical protein
VRGAAFGRRSNRTEPSASPNRPLGRVYVALGAGPR